MSCHCVSQLLPGTAIRTKFYSDPQFLVEESWAISVGIAARKGLDGRKFNTCQGQEMFFSQRCVYRL
jgi:hypothetical protein